VKLVKCAVTVLLGLAAVGSTQADDTTSAHQFNANVRLNYYQVSKELHQHHDIVGATGDVKIESDWSESLTSKAEVRWHNPELDRSVAKPEVLEAFALWRSEQFDVKLGKQIVAWGRADGINPTDNLTPRNYSIQLPFEEDQRSGVSALKVNYFPDTQKTITFYLTPSFQPSKLPQSQARDIYFLDRQPTPTRSRWPFGLKFDMRGDQVDWSLSYFRGFKLLPEWQASDSANTVILHYPKIAVFGADVTVNLGRYGWRAELARVERDEPQTVSGFRSNWMLVTGVDRNFYDNLNVNVQLILQQNGNVADLASIAGSNERNMALVNAIRFNQESARKLGSTMRVGKKWLNDTLETELLVFSYFKPNTSYWRPLLTYSFKDDMKITVGAELYYGKANTYFGSNKPIQGLFTELRYIF